jgi:hypothetical protein
MAVRNCILVANSFLHVSTVFEVILMKIGNCNWKQVVSASESVIGVGVTTCVFFHFACGVCLVFLSNRILLGFTTKLIFVFV